MIHICRLPDELIVLIIRRAEWTTPDNRDEDFFNTKTHEFRWVWMASVCTRFRNAAHRTPQLWTWVD
jgi:hypothetical protein